MRSAYSPISNLKIRPKKALPPADMVQLERSLEYPELSAGRLMQTSFVTAPPFWTAGQAIDMIRDAAEENLPECG
jgi:magnesium transporter